MRISTKLALFFAGVTVAFGVFAAVSLAQLRSMSRDYELLINTSIRDMDRARVVQVEFKKQVQEWKDVLLRGHNPDDLARYTRQFHDEAATVTSEAQALEVQVTDAEARELLREFVVALRTLNEKYEQAYQVYLEGNADFKAADKLVRGQDRAPTNLFDRVVERLDEQMKTAVAMQQASARRNLGWAVVLSGALLGALCLLGLLTVRNILSRLAKLKSVSDRIGHADIEGLSIPISGTDEIGQFGESMQRIYSAFEELLKLAAAATPHS